MTGGWDTVTYTKTDTLEKKENPEWEDLKTGEHVMHKRWGKGQILSKDDKYIIVKFKSRKSRFFYPSAFENGYLIYIGVTLQ